MEDLPLFAHSANDRNSALKKCKCIKTGMGTANSSAADKARHTTYTQSHTHMHSYTQSILALSHTLVLFGYAGLKMSTNIH